ncbi:MAG: hypothetical protein KDC10_03625 [Calditrichaeota bacterium]|nr:hypothetical protein [Calditrichota bacterium]
MDSLHGWDALRYQSELSIEPAAGTIAGHMRLLFTSDVVLDSLELHLHALEWGSPEIAGQPLSGQRSGDRLMIALGEMAPAPGDSAWLELDWWGTPTTPSSLGMFITAGQVYTSSDPWGTRNWMPCYDEPFDKALWSQTIRVPENFQVLSNGILNEVTPHGDGTHSFHYEHAHPVSTYLLSVCAYPYSVIESDWNGLPLTWMVYPSHVDEAATLFARVPQMLTLFSTLWGDYPFESYAMGEAPIYGGTGGMEHQTCTTLGHQIIASGNPAYETIVAHELAHQWWGDALTPVHFREAWLNEGWATYAEALFVQDAAGGDPQAFQDYFESQIRQPYLSWDSAFDPIVDPSAQNFNDFFSVNQYEKAACVIHMLRFLLGEQAFEDAQRLWYTRHRNGVVNSEDYRAVMEEVSGLDLGGFFQQWIHTGGYPSWDVAVEARDAGSDSRVVIGVAQSHPRMSDPLSRVPVRISTSQTELDTVMLIPGPGAQLVATLPGTDASVEFNHGLVALGRSELITVPADAALRVTAWSLNDQIGGDGDGNLSEGESAMLSITVQNEGYSLWNLALAFDQLPDGLQQQGSFPTVELLGWGQSVTLSGILLQNQSIENTQWADAWLLATHDDGSGFPVPFRFRVGDPDLLLVDASATGVGSRWWSPELDSLSAFHDRVLLADLPVNAAARYRNLLLVTGEQDRMLPDVIVNTLAQFLSGDGWVWISGQDALDASGPGSVAAWLNVTIDNDDVPAVYATGSPGGPLDGLTALLIGSGGAANQTRPDAFSSTDPFWEPVMQWSSGETAALSSQQFLVLGFGLEAASGMGTSDSRRDLIDRCLAVLDPTWVGVGAPGSGTPVSPSVRGNLSSAPNPFNPRTRISLELASAGIIRLDVYDLRGARVACLHDGRLEPGQHSFDFDGSGLASGLYLVQLEENGVPLTSRKLLLLK